MNIKRYLGASLALCVFMFLYEWVVHGMALMPMYEATASIWRNHEAMQALFHINMLVMCLGAFWLTFIFTRCFHDGGVKNGLHFGFYLGVFAALQAFAAFFYLPIPLMLAVAWFGASFVEILLGSALVGLIYHD